jgi:hypothetical protein
MFLWGILLEGRAQGLETKAAAISREIGWAQM